MEGAGVALAVTSLVLEAFKLYNKCKDSSTIFRHLTHDLATFHQTLDLNQEYLLHLKDSRVACEELITDIEKLLGEHRSRSLLRRARAALSSDEIHEFTARLAVQINALNACASELRRRGIVPHTAGGPRPTTSFQVALEHMNELWSEYYHRALEDVTLETRYRSPRPIVLRSSVSSGSSSSASTAATFRLNSYESSITPESRSSVSSNSSALITQKDAPQSLLPFDWRLSRSRAESIETANDNKTATLCTLLIEVSRTPQALGDDAEQVKALLSEGATFECTDTEYRRTPLIWAIVTGRQDLVKLFLDGTLLGEKASLDTYDGKWLWPPIVWAVVEDKPDILDVLIRQGADLTVTDTRYGRTALLWAASLGRSCALRVLIESDLGPGPVNALDKDGMTALALSYSDGHRETAELLVKVGADPNFRFRNGSSLLEWTILAKDEDFARLLLDNGAEAKSITTSGVSPLILATQKNLPVAAETLVEKGADVQCLDDEGLSALTVAIKDQREEIAAMLIRNGAAVNARDPEGNAPLLWAIGRQNERLVRMLIKSGATLASADVEAMLVWAEQTGNEEIGHLVLTGSGQHPLNSNGSGLVRRLGMSTAQPEDDADGRVRCNSNS